jgi:hypothetical protein
MQNLAIGYLFSTDLMSNIVLDGVWVVCLPSEPVSRMLYNTTWHKKWCPCLAFTYYVSANTPFRKVRHFGHN